MITCLTFDIAKSDGMRAANHVITIYGSDTYFSKLSTCDSCRVRPFLRLLEDTVPSWWFGFDWGVILAARTRPICHDMLEANPAPWVPDAHCQSRKIQRHVVSVHLHALNQVARWVWTSCWYCASWVLCWNDILPCMIGTGSLVQCRGCSQLSACSANSRVWWWSKLIDSSKQCAHAKSYSKSDDAYLAWDGSRQKAHCNHGDHERKKHSNGFDVCVRNRRKLVPRRNCQLVQIDYQRCCCRLNASSKQEQRHQPQEYSRTHGC